MRYTCKCGKMAYEGIYPPKDCWGCDECNTTFATNSSQCKERIPHQMEILYILDNPKWDVCMRCGTAIKRLDDDKKRII